MLVTTLDENASGQTLPIEYVAHIGGKVTSFKIQLLKDNLFQLCLSVWSQQCFTRCEQERGVWWHLWTFFYY